MTHFNTLPKPGASPLPAGAGADAGHFSPSRWVKTRFSGTDKYELTVLEKTENKQETAPGFAYAKLSLMGSGAVLATFPTMGMVSGTIKNLLGTTALELSVPLILPASIFGHDIEIAAGPHPIVFVLESWVVLFRPKVPGTPPPTPTPAGRGDTPRLG